MAWDSLWLGGHIATCDPSHDPYGIIEHAAVAVKDGHIAWLGRMLDLPNDYAQQTQTIHDFSHQWLTPGLIDCHTHLVYAGDRIMEFEQRLLGENYISIANAGGGIQATVRACRAASETELFELAAKRLQQWLAEGVTTIEIKSGYGLDVENECKLLRAAQALAQYYPIRVHTTFLGAHTVPVEMRHNPTAYLDLICEQMLPIIANHKLAHSVDAFCESIAFSPNQVRQVFSRAQALGFSIKLHADQLSDLNGAALAAEFNALSADHLEYTNSQGVQALKAAGTVAVLLPGAFYSLQATQKPPIAELRQANVPMAIATDHNPGSSPIHSLLCMLNLACTLWQMTPAEALLGVTQHAATALGIGHSHGSVALGKVADFALWDISHPAELAYRLGHNPCLGRVLGGQALLAHHNIR
jgi:imidazolonepropionase